VAEDVLRIRGLTKRFGGLVALDRVDVSVPERSVLAIIGPNGSGKTTFFNCVSGIYEPTEGSVELRRDGIWRNLVGLRPDLVTRAGIARTFQTIRLFPEMTILENVLVGMHAGMKAGFVQAALRTSRFRDEERFSVERARELLSFFGDLLLPRADEVARNLSYANQRRLEIVRAMATAAPLLLLDEPAAGMNPAETERLMHDIVRLKERGHTVLLIEHDMVVIASISDQVIALDHGQKIAAGSFDEVRRHPQVLEAYLGRGASSKLAGPRAAGPPPAGVPDA
jgi:branched-chain amino acid transport system ATP-binding protein